MDWKTSKDHVKSSRAYYTSSELCILQWVTTGHRASWLVFFKFSSNQLIRLSVKPTWSHHVPVTSGQQQLKYSHVGLECFKKTQLLFWHNWQVWKMYEIIGLGRESEPTLLHGPKTHKNAEWSSEWGWFKPWRADLRNVLSPLVRLLCGSSREAGCWQLRASQPHKHVWVV